MFEDDFQEDTSGLPNFLQYVSKEIEDAPLVSVANQTESGTEKPYQRKANKDQILRDNTYKNIYIKKFVKSNDGKSGLKKEDHLMTQFILVIIVRNCLHTYKITLKIRMQICPRFKKLYS